MEDISKSPLLCNKLKTTLHSEDKEKLRRKLKILQKAYAKTEQRLKRAEHAETVRKHARSGITEQNLQDQSNPGVNSSFSTKPLQPLLNQDTAIRTTPCISQDQCDTEVQDESDNSGRSPAVRFHLPSDAACHLLPETGPNLARGHRSSSALRLRSRQSRLRWEKRWRESAEAVGSTYNSEEGQEQSQAIEGAGEPEMKQVNTAEVDTVSEREELLADSESQSPSLLLTHWNTTGYSEREEREGKERGEQEQIGRETESKEQGRKECKSLSPLLTHWTPTAHSDRPRPKENQNSRGEGTGKEREFERGKEVEYPQEGQRCEMLYEESGGKNFEHELDKKIQKERGDGIREIREEKNEEGLEKTRESHNNRSETMGPLSSSTLVEGLLFPTEYYVRTTRRMIYSQSQSDMQAVTLSQLTGGRQCRSRGRGKKRCTQQTREHPDQLTQTDRCSVKTLAVCQGSQKPSQIHTQMTNGSQSLGETMSNEFLANNPTVDPCLSRTACTTAAARGSSKREQGKGSKLECSVSIYTNNPSSGQASDHQHTGMLISPSQSIPEINGAECCLNSVEPAAVLDRPELPPLCPPATQSPPGVDGPEPRAVSACLEKIMRKSSSGTEKSPQAVPSWRSLLLPSPPAPEAQLLPLPLGPAVDRLVLFDLQQDFHLPDDQFASLKLHKLRQVITATATEPFASPSYITRSSIYSASALFANISHQVDSPPLPLSLTLSVPNFSYTTEKRLTALQSVDRDQSTAQLSSEKLSTGHFDEGPADQQPEDLCVGGQLYTHSKDTDTVVCQSARNCIDQPPEKNSVSQSGHNPSNTAAKCRLPTDHHSTQSSNFNSPALSKDQCTGEMENNFVGHSTERAIVGQSPHNLTKKKIDSPGAIHQSGSHRSTNQQTDDKPVSWTSSYSECRPQGTSEDLSNCSTADCQMIRTQKDSDALDDSCTKCVNMNCPSKNLNSFFIECPSASFTKPHTDRSVESPTEFPVQPYVNSQLLLSPSRTSPCCPLLTPNLLSSAVPSSHPLPSLGLTPHPFTRDFPLTSSPSAPILTLSASTNPSTHALSPSCLSPCPSLTPLTPNSPLVSTPGQVQASSNSPLTANQSQGGLPRVSPSFPTSQTKDSYDRPPQSTSLNQTLPALKLDTPVKREGGYEQVEGTDEMSEDCVMRWTHTLKAPAGGGLVDACCFSGPSGGLWVAAAGKWAVCVWDLTSASEWSLIHTWTFNEPVINVFPIPDAAGLLCVTLGQLEIREVRMLSCSRLLQMLLCEGVVQAVVGVARCRVVSSSHSATVSTLQLFTLSEDSSKPTYEPLVSPGVCVGALAAVDGLSDVLIGSAEGGHLFIWNLRTGQLLKRISFGEGLSNTVCLRGYSDCGVLFVLLQHNLLNSLENEQKKYYKQDEMVSMEVKEREGKRITLFSLIAANPLNGKSTLATQLFEPEAWSSRLCDADVQGTSVVGLSQSGSVFVWELEGQGGSRVVWASETEGWQLARWGSGDTLVTGHHNGDLSLYRYTVNRTSLNHSTPKRL